VVTLSTHLQKFALEYVTALTVTLKTGLVPLSPKKIRTWLLDVTTMGLAKPKSGPNWIRKPK
jgi:hypothetical protein